MGGFYITGKVDKLGYLGISIQVALQTVQYTSGGEGVCYRFVQRLPTDCGDAKI